MPPSNIPPNINSPQFSRCWRAFATELHKNFAKYSSWPHCHRVLDVFVDASSWAFDAKPRSKLVGLENRLQISRIIGVFLCRGRAQTLASWLFSFVLVLYFWAQWLQWEIHQVLKQRNTPCPNISPSNRPPNINSRQFSWCWRAFATEFHRNFAKHCVIWQRCHRVFDVFVETSHWTFDAKPCLELVGLENRLQISRIIGVFLYRGRTQTLASWLFSSVFILYFWT